MDMAWRRFGHYDVRLLLDGIFETTTDVLVHAQGDAARLRAIAAWGSTAIAVDVNCFALRGPDGIILVDAGTGAAWGAGLGHARAALDSAGIRVEAVDTVLLTHLHGDHALGLLDGAQAVFPRADIMVPADDLAFFTDPAAREATPEARRSGFTLADALLAAYPGRVGPIPVGPVLPQIDALALPGHTPGHGGYLIGEGPDRLLLLGDALHLGVQATDPDLGLAFDLDPARAAETRRAILGQAAAAGWTIAGGHLHGFGHVVAAGGAFRIEPA